MLQDGRDHSTSIVGGQEGQERVADNSAERQYIHASRERNYGAVEKAERNKTQSAEMENPAPKATGQSGCNDRERLSKEHVQAKPASILACKMHPGPRAA